MGRFRLSDAKAVSPKVGKSFSAQPYLRQTESSNFITSSSFSSSSASRTWNCTETPGSECQKPSEAMPRHHFHPNNHQRWEMLPEVRDAGSTSHFRKPRRRGRFAPMMQG